jgi:glycosyltransferase involved in cell wall biosynthesis
MDARKKRILVVMQASDLDDIFLSTGGVDTVCKTLLSGYRLHQSKNFEYTFLVFDPLNQVQKCKLIKIGAYDCYMVNFKDTRRIKIPTFIYQFYKVRKYIKLIKPDIVHCHQDSWIIGALFKKVQKIVTLHGYRKICRKKIGTVNDFIYEKLFPAISDRIVDKYTCVSRSFSNQMPEKVHKKISIVYNPLSPFFYHKELPKNYSEATLVFVGLVIPRKRVELCVEVLKKTREKGINAQLFIVGPQNDPFYSKKLNQIIVEYSLTRFVSFFGHLNADQINELYNNCHFGLSFSREETFGLVPLEMFQSGLEVFCSRVGVFQDTHIFDFSAQELHLFDVDDTSIADTVSNRIFEVSSKNPNAKTEKRDLKLFTVNAIISAYENEYSK